MQSLPSYDEVFTFQNLYEAHLKARKGKRHKKDVILFETHLGMSLAFLCDMLSKRAYHIEGYHHFVIHEPKERNIQSLSYQDRIVQHCLVDNYLMPLLDNHLIYDNAACRKEKGTDFARDRVKQFLTSYYRRHGNEGYVLQFDIHSYFPSMDHVVLKRKLIRLIQDKDILSMIFSFIDSYEEKDNPGKGLPMGNQTSQCFALIYLDGVDRLIKEKYRMKYYSRYMDDGIIISESKEKLRELLRDIKEACLELKLELNPKKTRILRLKDGFTYLGFRYRLLSTGKVLMTFPRSKERRIKRYLRKRKKEGKDVSETICSFKGHASKGNEYRFMKGLEAEVPTLNHGLEE